MSELYKLPFPHSPALLLVSGYAPVLHERLFTCTVDLLAIIYNYLCSQYGLQYYISCLDLQCEYIPPV